MVRLVTHYLGSWSPRVRWQWLRSEPAVRQRALSKRSETSGEHRGQRKVCQEKRAAVQADVRSKAPETPKFSASDAGSDKDSRPMKGPHVQQWY